MTMKLYLEMTVHADETSVRRDFIVIVYRETYMGVPRKETYMGVPRKEKCYQATVSLYTMTMKSRLKRETLSDDF